jgi:hypothetical protein
VLSSATDVFSSELSSGISVSSVKASVSVMSDVVSDISEVWGTADASGIFVISSVRISSASVAEASSAEYWLRAAAKTAKAETISAAMETVMNAIMRFLVFILPSADKFFAFAEDIIVQNS